MTLRITTGRTEADLERDDLLLFNNVLNEVCNGFTVPAFESSIGAPESHVRDLLRRIHTLEADQGVCVPLLNLELSILENALRETLRELGVEEFSARTGLPFEFGLAALRELEKWSSR